MNRIKVEIELFEEHKEVNYYTITFENNLPEVEKFINKFSYNDSYANDIDEIYSWIDRIGENGAFERYFRPEGFFNDSLNAIPLGRCKLRLFCLRITDNIVILGNGGVKKTKSYNLDPLLNCYANVLQEAEKYLQNSIKNEKTFIYGKSLMGRSIFYLDKNCDNEEE